MRCFGDGPLGYGNSLSIGDDELASAAGAVVVGARSIAVACSSVVSCAVTVDLKVLVYTCSACRLPLCGGAGIKIQYLHCSPLNFDSSYSCAAGETVAIWVGVIFEVSG